MQAADAVLLIHPAGSAATSSLAQILVQPKKEMSLDSLWSYIGASQLNAVRRFKDCNMGRLDLVNDFIKETEALGDKFVRKYSDKGYSAQQLTNLVSQFRAEICDIELKYMLIIRSDA